MAARVSLLVSIFSCLCFSVTAQICPPIDTPIAQVLLRQLADGGTYHVNFFQHLCTSYGNQVNQITSVTLAINNNHTTNEVTNTNSTDILVARCSSSGVWMADSTRAASDSIFDLPLVENCSRCGQNNAVPICTTPCNVSCSSLGGSGRCFGAGDNECCPFYSNGTCISSCPIGADSNSTFICETVPVSINIQISNQTYSFGSNNFYIHDPSQGSPDALIVQCNFNASNNSMSTLRDSSYWAFDLLNDTIDRQLQASDFGLPIITNTTLSFEAPTGNASLSFIQGRELRFQPSFIEEMVGRYACGVRNVTFDNNIDEPVIVSITQDNPLLINNGPSTLNLIHPQTTFAIGPIIAEYRSTGQGQRIATNEMGVYYNASTGGQVSGQITLINMETRMYRVTFSQALPPVTTIGVKFSVNGGPPANFNVLINSHGIIVSPPNGQRADVRENSTITLNCTSLVPSVDITWNGPGIVNHTNPILSLSNVSTNASGIYTCSVGRSVPSGLPSMYQVTVIVYPTDVVLYNSFQILPNPSIINNNDNSVTIDCYGLNGGLMWTSDSSMYPNDLSQLNSSHPVYVNGSGTNYLSLVITRNSASLSNSGINFTCVSSAMNVSVFRARGSIFIRRRTTPSMPLTVGERTNTEYVIAYSANGVTSSPTSGIQAHFSVTSDLSFVQRAPFIFVASFTVSSNMNNTDLQVTVIESSGPPLRITVTIPSVSLITMPPYRYISRSTVSLQCQSTTYLTWVSNTTQQVLLPPQYNRSSTNNNTLVFTPYIYNFTTNYPPQSFGLSPLAPATSNMTQITDAIFVCTICDNMDVNSSNCLPNEYANPQFIPLDIQYHPVTLTFNDQILYNNSIVTSFGNRNNLQLSCTSTQGHSNLRFTSSLPVLSDYLSNGDLTNSLVLDTNETISVSVVNSNEITLTFEGMFTVLLSASYSCHSMESGVNTSVILNFTDSDNGVFQLLTSPNLTLTIGTSAFIPFRASFDANGSPAQSTSTYSYLRVSYPTGFNRDLFVPLFSGSVRAARHYEISPYNFGIYFPVVLGDIAGTTTVSHVEVSQRFNITINTTIPTLTPVQSLVVVREGTRAVLSCTPSNSQVLLEWRQLGRFFPPVAGSTYMYNDTLRHTLIINDTTDPSTEGTYYCYVAGDVTDQYARRGEITFNILQTCPQSVSGGVVWPVTLEGQTATIPCNRLSSQFNSQVVVARRHCLNRKTWSTVLFDGCTFVRGGGDAFELFTLPLTNASNVSQVMDRRSLLIQQFTSVIESRNPHLLSVSVTNIFAFSSNVMVVGEATYNTSNDTSFDVSLLVTTNSVAGFSISGSDRSFYAFQPSGVCECRPYSEAPVRIIDGGEGAVGQEGNLPIILGPGASSVSFQRLCYGVIAEPCNCTLNMNCTCINPYVGNGNNCTVDTDSDGYPDQALDSSFAPECLNNDTTSLLYCNTDTCPSVYNPDQNPPICDNFTQAIIGGCFSETDSQWNILWPSVSANTTSTQQCPGGTSVSGLATRFCDANGNWSTVNVDMCRSRVIAQIQNTASVLFSTDVTTLSSSQVKTLAQEATVLVEKLSNATNTNTNDTSLFPNDLSVANDVLSSTIQTLNASFVANNQTAAVNRTAIADVLSNVLNINNLPGWRSLQQSNPTMGSELLLENSEVYGLYLAQSNNTQQIISRGNIVIRANQVSPSVDVSFPAPNDLINFTNTSSVSHPTINIPSALLNERAAGSSTVPVVNIIFNNLQDFLQNTNSSINQKTGSVILSSQVNVQRGTAATSTSLQTTPVSISFGIIFRPFKDPSCVFWDFSNPLGQGSFSPSGISTVSNGSSIVTCLSTHLTSFAVLVDVSGGTKNPIENKVLSVLSYIGVAISIVCLVLTVVFFLSFGKKLFESVHNLVHLNLAISLLLGYIIFAAGIETAAGNKIACTFVAALLHYFFLSAFFWMLCEGVMLYLMLVVVFSTIAKKWWFFLLMGWVPSLLIVIVSVGAAHNYYTEGHDFCWLSVDRHVIWAFIIPMLIIIIINAVFLVLVLISLIKNRGARNVRKQQENKRVDLVKTSITASVILLPLLGLTWVFGLLAIDQNTSFFAWIFTILNSLQGLAIFIFHVIRNERVWKYFTGKYKNYKLHSSEGGTSTSGKGTKKRHEAFTASTSSGGRYEMASISVKDDNEKKQLEPMSQINPEFNEKEELKKEEEQEPDIIKEPFDDKQKDEYKEAPLAKSDLSQEDMFEGDESDHKLRFTKRDRDNP